MDPENDSYRRNFVTQLERAAARNDVALRWKSDGWVAELRASHRRCHVVGYNFPVNDAASALAADDKVATSVLLTHDGVPNVPHALLRLHHYESVADAARPLPLPVVVKPLSGSGGRDVIRADTRARLLDALKLLEPAHRALAVCPWVPVRHEYRVVVLHAQPLLVFEKHLDRPAPDPSVRPWDERFEWRHNLKHGTSALVLDEPHLCGRLTDVARQAMVALGLRFGSVDIVDCGGELSVIEVNSGVCLERFSSQSEAYFALAQRVYESAVAACFSPPPQVSG
ncbi:RimK family alpha-L-glutamate ligase [Streptomyces sp. NPDC049813]|uniref:RimK family alpha-L-glutamate ligase n=1 Tax=Streptomyces sp. NPDC049813 TaxID=3365597 RepID=UPI00378F59EA